MKVLGIYGSPRKQGNSDLLLDSALRGAAGQKAKISRIYARDLKISGCRACGGCNETGRCKVRDAMQDLYPVVQAADAIVVATPVYFCAVPAQLKAFIDRMQALWNLRRLTKPRGRWNSYDKGRGYLIAVGATKGKQAFTGVELTARYFFDSLDMSYEGGLLFPQVEARGAIKDRPGALQQAFELGSRLAK